MTANLWRFSSVGPCYFEDSDERFYLHTGDVNYDKRVSFGFEFDLHLISFSHVNASDSPEIKLDHFSLPIIQSQNKIRHQQRWNQPLICLNL